MARVFDRRQILSACASLAMSSPCMASPTRADCLARGFNLPDLAPMRAKRYPDSSVLRELHRRGMSHVRLPCFAERFLPYFSDGPSISRALDDLDRALDMLLEHRFAVSIDMHPGDELTKLYRRDPQGAFAALLGGWLSTAQRVRGRPSQRVFIELLNEPPTTDTIWRAQAQALIHRLRQVLPDSTMIVGAAPFERVDALENWPVLHDPNTVYAAHYYDPMAFTHQGETWDSASPYAKMSGVPFPISPSDPGVAELRRTLGPQLGQAGRKELDWTLSKPWNERTIGRAFAPLGAWSRKHSVSVVINEFGVLRFKASPHDRATWIGAVRRQAEHQGFGWAHWEYSNGFGLIREDGSLDPSIVEALLPGRTRDRVGAH